MVEATLDAYKKVMASLLPTPTKSHYTFNLRDISRVMQVGGGLMGMHSCRGPCFATGNAEASWATAFLLTIRTWLPFSALLRASC